jgi:hypothetical protein
MLYFKSERSRNVLNRAVDSLFDITALKRTGAYLGTFGAFKQKFNIDIRNDVIQQMRDAGKTGRPEDQDKCLLKHDIKAGMLKKLLLARNMRALGIGKADVNALEAFGMTAEGLFDSLRSSALYKATEQTAPPENAGLTSAQLALELKQMLAEPGVRKAIREDGLTAAEASALGFYMYTGFVEIQAALREQDENAAYYQPLVDACHEALAKLPPLPGEIKMVYRGTDFFGNATPGSVYTDPAFVSTSKDEHLARTKFPGRFLLKIKVPNGTAGRDMSALAGAGDGESEVLFPPGTRFQVEEVEELSGDPDDGKTTIVTLRPLPPQ